MIWGFEFEYNLSLFDIPKKPRILWYTQDIMVLRDARRDSPDPPPEQSTPDLQDEENIDARPDHEEMGSDGASHQQIPGEVGLLEKQEKKGFKDLATLLSELPKLHVCGRG